MLKPETLLSFAKYLWWKTPPEAIASPERLIAQVMDIGTYEDVQKLTAGTGKEMLRGILRNAQAGYFNPKSWAYWHYRLGLVKPGEQMPGMPKRILG